MSGLIGLFGIFIMLAGLIVFIVSIFTEIPKKIGAIITIAGFILINLSNFPKDALYGILGFIAMIVGLIMLLVSLRAKKPTRISYIVIIVGFLAFSGSISTETEAPQVSDVTTAEPAEAEAVEKSEKDSEPAEVKEGIEATTDEKEEPVEKVIGIGDKLVVEDVHYVINEITTAQNVGGEYGKDAKSQFTIINLTVQNEQNEAIKVDSDQFKLVSGERSYEASGSAGIYANKDYDFFYTEINPGVSLTGNVVFDVPADLENLQLHIQTDFWDTETGIVHLQ